MKSSIPFPRINNGFLTSGAFFLPTLIAILFLTLSGCNQRVKLEPKRIDPSFQCTYQEIGHQMVYSVTNGKFRQTYTTEGKHKGAIAFVEAVHDLVADRSGKDKDDSTIACLEKGTGTITITFKLGDKVLFTCTHCFVCEGKMATPVEVKCE